MASITKKRGRYYARVRRIGYRTVCKVFTKREDALRWSRKIEIDLENGVVPQQICPFNDIINRYEQTVSRKKKSHGVEIYRLDGLRRSFLAELPIHRINRTHIAQYRDKRLEQVAPSTVGRELTVLSHMFTVAMQEWGYDLPSNPVSKIRKPSPNRPRDRRLEDGEEKLLLSALSRTSNVWIRSIILFAIETAMRRGELLKLTWENVYLDKRFAHLPDTKNGDNRNVPLSSRAIEILSQIPVHMTGTVFPVSETALRGLWKRACNRADIKDLRFHDLRHEATSRFFEKGLNVMEVAAITGHKDLRMLQRYTHLRAEDLAKKLG